MSEPRYWHIEKRNGPHPDDHHICIRGPDTVGEHDQLQRLKVVDIRDYDALKSQLAEVTRELENKRGAMTLEMHRLCKGWDAERAKAERYRAFVNKWLAFEQSCIEKDGPYVSKNIPNLMAEAKALDEGEK